MTLASAAILQMLRLRWLKLYMAHLDRKIVVVRWTGYHSEKGVSDKNVAVAVALARKLHDAFGGELWQSDQLRFKDRIEISKPFDTRKLV